MISKTSIYRTEFIFILFIVLAAVIRIIYFTGHVFSDDAYYANLGKSILDGDFGNNYLGYPVFPLRINQLALTALSFKIFGFNEFATIVFPFIISVANILLTYKTAMLLTENKTVSTAAVFLISFFPTDIIFATINFADAPNIFFINLGIYFLIKSYKLDKLLYALAGGVFLFISMQFKENIYYVFILLIILLLYFLIHRKIILLPALVGIIFIAANLFIEAFIYFILYSDFYYRLTITQLNYQFSYYDFFPYTAQKFTASGNYISNLFSQIFLINGRAIFLRRFYLFLPIAAAVSSLLNFKNKKNSLLNFWFWGLLIMLIAFTTSLTEYKPLDLKRSWYIYLLLMPIIILSAQLIASFKNKIRYALLAVYFAGSIIMCNHYLQFFDLKNNNNLKDFLRVNKSKIIYTDHFTKYSIDLIRSDENEDFSKRILGSNFSFNKIKPGELVLFNKKHIDELKMQKYSFPDFSILNSTAFKKIAAFNDFIFYRKTKNVSSIFGN